MSETIEGPCSGEGFITTWLVKYSVELCFSVDEFNVTNEASIVNEALITTKLKQITQDKNKTLNRDI